MAQVCNTFHFIVICPSKLKPLSFYILHVGRLPRMNKTFVINVIIIILGVVVIDDQPEVSNVDPAYLFDSNDGFQRVVSKNKKNRQRVEEILAVAQQKKNEILKEKREKKDNQQSKVHMVEVFYL